MHFENFERYFNKNFDRENVQKFLNFLNSTEFFSLLSETNVDGD